MPSASRGLRLPCRSGAREAGLPAAILMMRHGTAGFYRVWRSHPLSAAFSSEVDTGLREQNASNKKLIPTDPPEKHRDFRSRLIGILAMGKMPDVPEWREIEQGKGLAETIGPGVGKQRIVFGPANAGG